jgi:hypothetical protein
MKTTDKKKYSNSDEEFFDFIDEETGIYKMATPTKPEEVFINKHEATIINPEPSPEQLSLYQLTFDFLTKQSNTNKNTNPINHYSKDY